jgi:hypothetical protein
MIKLSNILKDVPLYEGLIYTTDIDSSEHYLNRWSIAHNKFIIKISPRNTLHLKFGEQPNNREIDNLLRLINNLGWFVSEYFVNRVPFSRKFVDIESFKKDVKEYTLLSVTLEAKYDLELNKYELTDMYHISPIKNVDKIERIGLVPRSLSKISYHPDRIYMTPTKSDALTVAELSVEGDTEFVLYKIDIGKLVKHNNGIRFFRDPNLGSGIYTLSNIPPKFLTKVEVVTL